MNACLCAFAPYDIANARSVGYAASAHATGEDGSCPNWPTGPDSAVPTGPELAGAYAIPRPTDAQCGRARIAATG